MEERTSILENNWGGYEKSFQTPESFSHAGEPLGRKEAVKGSQEKAREPFGGRRAVPKCDMDRWMDGWIDNDSDRKTDRYKDGDIDR